LLLDDEVFAVLTAIVVVASVFSAAMLIREGYVAEPFTAIGLLNENCRIGEYPGYVRSNSTVTLCLYVYNHEGKPLYWKVVYRLGSNKTLPTNTTPSPEPAIQEWRGVLGHRQNSTFKVVVRIPEIPLNTTRVTLIFELWAYDVNLHTWVYTGRWVHLHVNVAR